MGLNKVRTLFHSFTTNVVEGPEIFLSAPIYQWQETEAGQWVMENSRDLRYDVIADPNTYGHRVKIHGLLTEEQYTYFVLKFKK